VCSWFIDVSLLSLWNAGLGAAGVCGTAFCIWGDCGGYRVCVCVEARVVFHDESGRFDPWDDGIAVVGGTFCRGFGKCDKMEQQQFFRLCDAGVLFYFSAIRILLVGSLVFRLAENCPQPATSLLNPHFSDSKHTMASDILHIKDGYYFEVPRFLWRSNRQKASDFPDWLVRLDPDFQHWQAEQLVGQLREAGVSEGSLGGLVEAWQEWQHSNHKNEGWPLHAYLEKIVSDTKAKAGKWVSKNAPGASDPLKAYLAAHPQVDQPWFFEFVGSPEGQKAWDGIKANLAQASVVDAYEKEHGEDWGQEKIASYNKSLDGKVMIPQPFGTLRNAYQAESGFCLSRYMIIELVVACLLFFAFRWLAKRMQASDSPKGKTWNFLEGFVQAVRNNVVVPAMGEHDADRFMPFLWTIFFFILGCNLMGMVPWVGSPTASLGTTAALAGLVFLVGLIFGVKAFGIVGYLKNICPELGLPWYFAFWVVPLLWVIEFASLFIKHAVLAVRLLMNMGAGHLVLLGILGIGISVPAALGLSTGGWLGVAGISVVGTTILSVLEVFVAFLQAYVFTFLAALFIGSAIHHH